MRLPHRPRRAASRTRQPDYRTWSLGGLLALLAFSTQAQSIDTESVARRFHDRADQLALNEMQPLQNAYRAAVERFDQADGPVQISEAVNLLQYLGYHDSQASALRLCATLGLGFRVKVEHSLASYWCYIASQRTPEAQHVTRYIEQQFYRDPANTLADEP